MIKMIMDYQGMFLNFYHGHLLVEHFTRGEEGEFLSNEANVEILNLINDLIVFLDEINCLKLDEILQINCGWGEYVKNEENSGVNIENLIKLVKDYIDLYPRIKNDEKSNYRIIGEDNLNTFKEKIISYMYFLCRESDKEVLVEKLDAYNKKALELCANVDEIFSRLEESYIKASDLEDFAKNHESEIRFLNDFILQFIVLFECFSEINYLYFKDSTPRERIRNYNKFFNEIDEKLDSLSLENKENLSEIE
ncbi:hypothetical protein [Helicobacter pullorum]|uniref:hypothetical protein n=1 Tax=Helicobacter pullorum TaxID=35818 RepID=UPI0006BA7CB7|nr:hypothetical protein [Helicobacter pullorum]KPH53149.1 hypothetical protein HPU229313_02935 [Helicobacter pullorum]